MPLPKLIEGIEQDEFVKKIADVMRAREQVKTSVEGA
jgi:hypothetical protein